MIDLAAFWLVAFAPFNRGDVRWLQCFLRKAAKPVDFNSPGERLRCLKWPSGPIPSSSTGSWCARDASSEATFSHRGTDGEGSRRSEPLFPACAALCREHCESISWLLSAGHACCQQDSPIPAATSSETTVGEARLLSALCLSRGCNNTIPDWQRVLETSSPTRAVLRHLTGTGEGAQFESGRRGSAGNLRWSLARRFAFHQVG